MPEQQLLLCRYHYDPLDRLASVARTGEDRVLQFYQKSRLASEMQNTVQRTLFCSGDQLLAQQTHFSTGSGIHLLATDRQRSVLHELSAGICRSKVYSAYGYHRAEHDRQALPGFNGERLDPVTEHYLLGNGYRAFNPVLMRFNSPDRLSPFGRGGLNAYAYCVGNPVNFRDPTGHMPRAVRVSIKPKWLTVKKVDRLPFDKVANPLAKSQNSTEQTFLSELLDDVVMALEGQPGASQVLSPTHSSAQSRAVATLSASQTSHSMSTGTGRTLSVSDKEIAIRRVAHSRRFIGRDDIALQAIWRAKRRLAHIRQHLDDTHDLLDHYKNLSFSRDFRENSQAWDGVNKYLTYYKEAHERSSRFKAAYRSTFGDLPEDLA